MKDYNLTIQKDENIENDFVLENGQTSTLIVSQNLFGSIECHNIEQKLLETIIDNADNKGFVLNRNYKYLIKDVFSTCKGGFILHPSEQDVLSDPSIGKHHYYIVDSRRKSLVLEELVERFKRFPIGQLTLEESKSLVYEMIHYLNIKSQ